MASRTLRCAIEELADWYPRLFLEPYIVACVAVLCRYTDSPASFAVECDGIHSRWLGRADRFRLEVSWALEVSGTENLSELGRRQREKAVQALRNPFGWDAYVVVCGFGNPEHRIRLSGHAHEEAARAKDES
jgi:hypothetical protein